MVGDLLAGGALLSASSLDVPMPWFLQNPHGLTVVFAFFALCHLLLAQPIFGVAVAGQVAMGSCYVLSVELVTSMLVVYGRDIPDLHRWLLFVHEVVFNLGVSTSAVIIIAYDFDKTLPFYACACVSFCWAVVTLVFFSSRFGGEHLCSGIIFKDVEKMLYERHCGSVKSSPESDKPAENPATFADNCKVQINLDPRRECFGICSG